MTDKVQLTIPQSPLGRLWNLVSLFCGIVGLASIADSFAQWRGWILQLIETYRNIVHPIFEWAFSWVSLDIPPLAFDYLVIGILVASSYIKAIKDSDAVYGFKDFLPKEFWGENPIEVIVLILLRVIGWPIAILFYFFGALKKFDMDAYEEEFEKHGGNPRLIGSNLKFEFSQHLEAVRFFHWFGFVVLGLVLLLIVNGIS